jgi:hypothetical protein
VLIKRPPVTPDIRIQSARRILVSAAALFASASCSVDAPSADERSIGNLFPTEPEVVYSRLSMADHASSGLFGVTSAMPGTQKMQAYYGALLHLPNEALFWPAPLKSNLISESHE